MKNKLLLIGILTLFNITGSEIVAMKGKVITARLITDSYIKPYARLKDAKTRNALIDIYEQFKEQNKSAATVKQVNDAVKNLTGQTIDQIKAQAQQQPARAPAKPAQPAHTPAKPVQPAQPPALPPVKPVQPVQPPALPPAPPTVPPREAPGLPPAPPPKGAPKAEEVKIKAEFDHIKAEFEKAADMVNTLANAIKNNPTPDNADIDTINDNIAHIGKVRNESLNILENARDLLEKLEASTDFANLPTGNALKAEISAYDPGKLASVNALIKTIEEEDNKLLLKKQQAEAAGGAGTALTQEEQVKLNAIMDHFDDLLADIKSLLNNGVKKMTQKLDTYDAKALETNLINYKAELGDINKKWAAAYGNDQNLLDKSGPQYAHKHAEFKHINIKLNDEFDAIQAKIDELKKAEAAGQPKPGAGIPIPPPPPPPKETPKAEEVEFNRIKTELVQAINMINVFYNAINNKPVPDTLVDIDNEIERISEFTKIDVKVQAEEKALEKLKAKLPEDSAIKKAVFAYNPATPQTSHELATIAKYAKQVLLEKLKTLVESSNKLLTNTKGEYNDLTKYNNSKNLKANLDDSIDELGKLTKSLDAWGNLAHKIDPKILNSDPYKDLSDKFGDNAHDINIVLNDVDDRIKELEAAGAGAPPPPPPGAGATKGAVQNVNLDFSTRDAETIGFDVDGKAYVLQSDPKSLHNIEAKNKEASDAIANLNDQALTGLINDITAKLQGKSDAQIIALSNTLLDSYNDAGLLDPNPELAAKIEKIAQGLFDELQNKNDINAAGLRGMANR